jgi:hypothetical protein
LTGFPQVAFVLKLVSTHISPTAQTINLEIVHSEILPRGERSGKRDCRTNESK